MSDYQNLLQISIEAAIRAGEKTLKYFGKEFSVVTKKDQSPLTRADIESNQIINKILKPAGLPVLSEENKVIPYNVRRDWTLFWMVDPLDGTKEFIKNSPEYTVNIALIENNRPVLGVIFVPAQQILYYGTIYSGAFKVKADFSFNYSLILKKSFSLPIKSKLKEKVSIIASKSHMSEETIGFIDALKKSQVDIQLVSIGSSLKFCLLAEGLADIYPRFGPTMEWDTAAGQVIAESAYCEVIDAKIGDYLSYNKKELLNPSFIAYNQNYKETVGRIIL